MRKTDDRAYPILCASTAVVIRVVNVENGLNFVVARRDGSEGSGRSDVFGVRIDLDRSTGAEALHLSRPDPGGRWLIWLASTSLSPIPDFRKISSRPLMGAVMDEGACTVK